MQTESINTRISEEMIFPATRRNRAPKPRRRTWEDLIRDPAADHVVAGDSLCILACREYEDNGPSYA